MTNRAKKRLLLIYPSHDGKRRKSTFPSLTIPYLAALVPRPENYEIWLADENVEELPLHQPWDLVGITVMTHTARHSYELAQHLRQRGSKVVLGGWHVTALPNEALQHADTIITNEAEVAWPRLLEDFERNGCEFHRVYPGTKAADLGDLPLPRWDLAQPFGKFVPVRDGVKWLHRMGRLPGFRKLDRIADVFSRELVLWPVQTRRGCSVGCSFCSVVGAVRMRPFDHVIQEMAFFARKFNFRNFFIVDDNFGLFPEKTKNLLRQLGTMVATLKDEGINVRWFTQISVNFGEDEEMLRLMNQAGCTGVFLGIESISEENLKAEHKGTNKPKKFETLIGNFHRHCIATFLSFILGLPHDRPGVGLKTAEFAQRVRTQVAGFNALCPLPGTRDYEKMRAEGRVKPEFWLMPNGHRKAFVHPHLGVEELWHEVDTARKAFYSLPWMAERIRAAPPHLRPYLFFFNVAFRGVHLGENFLRDGVQLLFTLASRKLGRTFSGGKPATPSPVLPT